jgi:hypothetical protein
MTGDEHRSPRIAECRWGGVSIDGHGVVKDTKLYPGGARTWDWRETGTHHDPGIQPVDVVELLEHGAEVVVLSRGVLRMLKVCPETLSLLQEKADRSLFLPSPSDRQYSFLRGGALGWAMPAAVGCSLLIALTQLFRFSGCGGSMTGADGA